MKRVLLYELNEVPWTLIDHYVSLRPQGALAGLLQRASSGTTICRDTVGLQPWRTWPSLHRSMYSDEHHSLDLGQDPATFQGDDLWDVAAAAGKRVGVFGAMQSWPAKVYPTGGFYVPDTFARTPETVPESLKRFQAFNLSMTQENSFSSDGDLSPRQLARVGIDLVTKGLTARSMGTLASHLWQEKRERRFKAARPMMQAIPTFDLFWKLHRQTKPDLSIFFTNHVAGMMHRFWGDSMPGYQEGYERDPVYSTFVAASMDVFDQHLARMRRYALSSPETVIVIASSMGQGPIQYQELDETYVVEDPLLLASKLGLGHVEPGLAMYPRTSLLFDDKESASKAADRLVNVAAAAGPLFNDVRVEGLTVSFEINLGGVVRGQLLSDSARVPGEDGLQEVRLGEFGLAIRKRLGGGNTAYHIPEGVLIVDDPGLPADGSRPDVDLLDVAPYLLDLIGCEPGGHMRGSAERLRAAFAQRAA